MVERSEPHVDGRDDDEAIPPDADTTVDDLPFDLFGTPAPVEPPDDALADETPRMTGSTDGTTGGTIERVQRFFPGRVIDVVKHEVATEVSEPNMDAQVD
jgi:hypothetical protein